MNDEFSGFAPEIDEIIDQYKRIGLHSSNIQEDEYESKEIENWLQSIFEVVQKIQSKKQGKDDQWTLWIKAQCGPLSVFADEEEFKEMKASGEVESKQDLVDTWKSFYPHPVKWYQVSFVLYENRFFLLFDSAFEISFNLETKKVSGAHFTEKRDWRFLQWLFNEIDCIVTQLSQDATAYNHSLAEELPLWKRFGKIKRMVLWNNVNGIERLDETLGLANLKKFEQVVKKNDESKVLQSMTADEFFRICSLCYGANQYFNGEGKLSHREQYTRMADGRDEGLQEIPGDSTEAFEQWYATSQMGGHPWEICRGGNSTHITLQVSKEDNGWRLYLHGSSRIRVVETAKMAIALFRHQIPFMLQEAAHMQLMLNGEDMVGIVPDDVIPRYCHSYFPDEDDIFDFMNPWFDDKDVKKVIINDARWYPIEPIELKKRGGNEKR